MYYDVEGEDPWLGMLRSALQPQSEGMWTHLSPILLYISCSQLAIFSGDQHRVCLGKITNPSSEYKWVGEGVIAPDQSTVALLLDSGDIQVLTLERQFTTDNQLFLSSPLLEHHQFMPKMRVEVTFGTVFSFSERVHCISTVDEYILLGMISGEVKMVDWDGEVISSFQVASSPLTSISYTASHHILSTSTVDTCSLYQCSEPSKRSPRLLLDDLSLLWHLPGMYIAINPFRPIVAIGHITGEVLLVALSSKLTLHTLSMSRWGLSPGQTGPVSSCQWSPDGAVVAVGWRNCGLSVWSASGCRLLSTTSLTPKPPSLPSNSSSDALLSSASPRHSHRRLSGGLADGGVVTLLWGPSGSRLDISRIPSPDGYQKCRCVCIEFARAPDSLHASASLDDHCTLIADTGLHTLRLRDLMGGELIWDRVSYPSAYIVENWPIEQIISNGNGDVAVAGRRGLAVCSWARHKWRVFGNRVEEQSFHVDSFCWYRSLICIAHGSKRGSTYQSKLLVLPRDHLSFSAKYCDVKLAVHGKVRHLVCNDDYLAVLYRNGTLQHYRISWNGSESRVRIHLLHSYHRELLPASICLLSTLHPIALSGIQGKEGEDTVKTLERQEDGTLLVFVGDTSYEVAHGIEEFWLTGGNQLSNPYVEDALWCYGSNGLSIWYPFYGVDRSIEHSVVGRHCALDFDYDVFPVCIVPELGLAIGIAQTMSSDGIQVGGLHRFHLRTCTQPYLHELLSITITAQGVDAAITLARRMSDCVSFLSALELLLYGALTKDKDSHSPSLEQVIRLIDTFPDALALTAGRCARKCDVLLWPILFSQAGNPLHLFEICIIRKHLQDAMLYLRIIQHMRGTQQVAQTAIVLLEQVLALPQYDHEKVQNLIRFIAGLHEVFLDETAEEELDTAHEIFLLQEQLKGVLEYYALHWIKEGKFNRILGLSVSSGVEASTWLTSPKASYDQLGMLSLIQAMHADFQIEYPTIDDDADLRLSSDSLDGVDTLSPREMHIMGRLADNKVERTKKELEGLYRQFMDIERYDYALVISLLLMHREKTLAALYLCPTQVVKGIKDAMEQLENERYHQYWHHIEQAVREDLQNSEIIHKVESSDTFAGLSVKYGVSIEEIKRYNRIGNEQSQCSIYPTIAIPTTKKSNSNRRVSLPSLRYI